MSSQLIKKQIEAGYKKIYPITFIQEILDKGTGEKLSKILNRINHVYLNFKGNKEATRASLPLELQRRGIWITYDTNDSIVTEMYKGGDIRGDWEQIPDVEFVRSNASKIPDGAIIPEHLSPALWEMLLEEHTIINMPDDEDLTHNCRVLKFKNRQYCPSDPQGKGYIILRRNWVGGINVLEQDKISEANTIYEIRYNFDLKGNLLTLPESVTLLFNGGSINNGTLICNKTNILGISKLTDIGDVTVLGTFDEGLVMAMDGTIKWYDGTEWRKIESDATSLALSARVLSVSKADEPSATAEIVDNEVQFTFGLPKGDKGDKGEQGEKGEKGDPGDTAVATQTFAIFKSTGTDKNTPATPTGGHWDSSNDSFTPPEGWSRTDNLTGIIWMSTGIFKDDTGTLLGSWSTPVRISGEDGVPGTDGLTLEFIYKRTPTSLEAPALDVTNSPNTNGYVPSGWTNNPQGIDVNNQCEWVSTRKKELGGAWQNWNTPTIWSKWGVNGQDGAGIEYIYLRNNGESVNNPTPSNTSTDRYQEKGDYEDIEYIPEGWTDNPQGVTSTLRYEWVSQRKYRNGVWGAFSNPVVWSKWGEDGFAGLSVRTMYAKYSLGNTPPVVTTNINPGSIWGFTFPNYDNKTEAVWMIQAYVTYDNKLATVEDGVPEAALGWQGPWIVTGTSGENGNPVNWKTYVYKKSTTKPTSKPPVNVLFNDSSITNAGWMDYPNDTGQWWQCIGTVDGTTKMITEWSEILPVNGQDGTAQDGKKVEMRFNKNTSQITAPAINRAVRQPEGWTINPPQLTVTESTVDGITTVTAEYLWMTVATINPDDTLVKGSDGNGWSVPVRISGEQGPKGNTGPTGDQGPQGATGIPGVSFEVKYCLGTATTYLGNSNPSESLEGWLDDVPETTTENPYIWCIQGKKVYSKDEGGDIVSSINWGRPFRLSGINGLTGEAAGSQIVYPAGVYDVTKTYETTERIAPYVLDPSDGNYYVMNYIGTWTGTEQNNQTPSQSFANNGNKYWQKFESFDAVYAKVGIIANGLIGEAVFNGDYAFSQQGIDRQGNESSDYQDFCHTPGDIYVSNPYDPTCIFRPNWCVNFSTGEQWMGRGKSYFGPEGDGYVANENIKWNAEGKVTLGSNVTISYSQVAGITDAINQGVTEGVNNGLTDVNNRIDTINSDFDSWKDHVGDTFAGIDEKIKNNELTIGEINNKASLVSQMSNAELLFPNPEFTGEKLIDDFAEWVKYQHNNLRLYGVTKGYSGYHHCVIPGTSNILRWNGTETHTTVFFNYCNSFKGLDATIIGIDIKRGSTYYNIFEGSLELSEEKAAITYKDNPLPSDSPYLLSTDSLYIRYQSEWGDTSGFLSQEDLSVYQIPFYLGMYRNTTPYLVVGYSLGATPEGTNYWQSYHSVSNEVAEDTPPNGTGFICTIRNYSYMSPTDLRIPGLQFAVDARPNARFLCRIVAKIPENFKLNFTNNQYGNGGTFTWLTDNQGTGKYKEYLYLLECGSTGNFQSVLYSYLEANDKKLVEPVKGATYQMSIIVKKDGETINYAPLEWRVAYATVFDLTANSKVGTYIDANGIYTGTINAAQITAGTIDSGLINTDAILSNGNKWALLKDGSGYLASKNINWGTDGTLRISGNLLGFTGSKYGYNLSPEGQGYVAGGAIKWDMNGGLILPPMGSIVPVVSGPIHDRKLSATVTVFAGYCNIEGGIYLGTSSNGLVSGVSAWKTVVSSIVASPYTATVPNIVYTGSNNETLILAVGTDKKVAANFALGSLGLDQSPYAINVVEAGEDDTAVDLVQFRSNGETSTASGYDYYFTGNSATVKLFIQNSSSKYDRKFTWKIDNLSITNYAIAIVPESGMSPSGITVYKEGNTITGIGLKAGSIDLRQGFYLTLDVTNPSASPIILTINCGNEI